MYPPSTIIIKIGKNSYICKSKENNGVDNPHIFLTSAISTHGQSCFIYTCHPQTISRQISVTTPILLCSWFLGGGVWSLNSGLNTCRAGALLLSPFCSGYFRDGVLWNYWPKLALNCHPPNLNLPSS
jgi:hypothetical protein